MAKCKLMSKRSSPLSMSSSMYLATFILLFDDFELFPRLFDLDQPQTPYLRNPTRCKDLICGRKSKQDCTSLQISVTQPFLSLGPLIRENFPPGQHGKPFMVSFAQQITTISVFYRLALNQILCYSLNFADKIKR